MKEKKRTVAYLLTAEGSVSQVRNDNENEEGDRRIPKN